MEYDAIKSAEERVWAEFEVMKQKLREILSENERLKIENAWLRSQQEL